MDTLSPGRSANLFLASLPLDAIALLQPSLKSMQALRGDLLFNADDEVDQVYFPHSGIISLLAVTRDGKAIETATVGRDGAVGTTAGFGLHYSFVRAVVQMPGVFSVISALKFRKAVMVNEALRNFCVRYNEVILLQSQTTVACNALHSVEQRFCRWLLQSRESADDDSVPLTQEFMAEMLGVRRTSVSEAAKRLQKAGYIVYSRGRIQISDRQKLEQLSCECHATIQRKKKMIWPPKG